MESIALGSVDGWINICLDREYTASEQDFIHKMRGRDTKSDTPSAWQRKSFAKNNTLSEPRSCFQLYLLSDEAGANILKLSADQKTMRASTRKTKLCQQSNYCEQINAFRCTYAWRFPSDKTEYCSSYPTEEQRSIFRPPLQFLAHGPNLKGVIVPRPLAASQSMHQHHTS